MRRTGLAVSCVLLLAATLPATALGGWSTKVQGWGEVDAGIGPATVRLNVQLAEDEPKGHARVNVDSTSYPGVLYQDLRGRPTCIDVEGGQAAIGVKLDEAVYDANYGGIYYTHLMVTVEDKPKRQPEGAWFALYEHPVSCGFAVPFVPGEFATRGDFKIRTR